MTGWKVAVVEPYTMQRRGLVQLLTELPGADVVFQGAQVAQLFRWVRSAPQSMRPDAAVLSVSESAGVEAALTSIASLQGVVPRIVIMADARSASLVGRLERAGVAAVISKTDSVDRVWRVFHSLTQPSFVPPGAGGDR
ncbi:hypothetical protein ACIPY5_19685 [Microbacterium sp. NPDC089698]|uniref:hypothetical protein n=1 Tax=Microbacterium sp. NPDC089698 TaxID=3364200 RepID=UPI00380927E9